MKVFFFICIACLSTLFAVAAKKNAPPQKQLQQALRESISISLTDKDAETVHPVGYHRTISQCRNQGNDHLISGYTSSLLITFAEQQPPVLMYKSVCSISLSQLLLFPNHYFW